MLVPYQKSTKNKWFFTKITYFCHLPLYLWIFYMLRYITNKNYSLDTCHSKSIFKWSIVFSFRIFDSLEKIIFRLCCGDNFEELSPQPKIDIQLNNHTWVKTSHLSNNCLWQTIQSVDLQFICGKLTPLFTIIAYNDAILLRQQYIFWKWSWLECASSHNYIK